MSDSPHVLVLPGLGDVHWALSKLPSWYRQRTGDKPTTGCMDVTVWSPEGRDRGGELVELCGFASFAGYWRQRVEGEIATLWKRLYYPAGLEDAVSIMEPFYGFDAVVAPNGMLRYGARIEAVPPKGCDPKYHLDLGTWEGVGEVHRQLDAVQPFVVLALSDHSIFAKHWLPHATPEWVDALVAGLHGRGLRVCLTGAEWDRAYCEGIASRHGPAMLRNLAGRTELEHWLHLVRRARAVIGFASGATILPTRFGTPTVALWHDYYPRPFWTSWVPRIDTTYHALDIATASPKDVLAHVP